MTKRVLFVCVENAGRSQMAEGFARACGLDASSAGTLPAEKINPVVVEAMKERGIALLGKPKMLTEQMIREADLVVTMGCSVEEVCPGHWLSTWRRNSLIGILRTPKEDR